MPRTDYLHKPWRVEPHPRTSRKRRVAACLGTARRNRPCQGCRWRLRQGYGEGQTFDHPLLAFQQLGVAADKLEAAAILNGVQLDDALPAGTLLKVVVKW